MMNLYVNNAKNIDLDTSTIENVAYAAFQHVSQSDDVELSILIDDDKAIQALNRKYRNIDKPTDVLAFPAQVLDPDTGLTYLGDIIISFDQAKIQAQQCGHDVGDEIAVLVIHGILHLLGYDHDTVKAKDEMWHIQNEILSKLNISKTTK